MSLKIPGRPSFKVSPKISPPAPKKEPKVPTTKPKEKPKSSPDPSLKKLKAKLREVIKVEKTVLLASRSAIEQFIEGLPHPNSPEFKSLDPKLKDCINLAYFKAESACRNLIVDSEISGKARFELCKFFATHFAGFSEVIIQLCDIWKHCKNGPQTGSLEDLYLLLCQSDLITSSQKVDIGVMLYNSGSLTRTYECLEFVASDKNARFEDRVEACKFLLTSQEPNAHSLSQEVLCEIIDDPKSLPKFIQTTTEDQEGSRSSATSDDFSSISDSEDSVPSFLKDSDDESVGGAGPADSEGEGDDASSSGDLFKSKRIPKKAVDEEKIARKLAYKQKVAEAKKDQRWQDNTKVRYGIIADFLHIKKRVTVIGKSKTVVEIPVIKTTHNREKLEPYEGIVLREFIVPVATLFTENPENHIRFRLMTASVLYQSDLETSREDGYQFLMKVAEDRSHVEDVRADALDMILRLSGPKRPDQRHKALKMIIELGREAADAGSTNVSNRVKTIYQNSQNIHDKTISGSVAEFIETIDSRKDTYSFSDIEKDLVGLYKEYKLNELQKKQARAAIYRCSIDHSLFGEEHFTVKKIFTYVWTVIQNYREVEKVEDPGGGPALTGEKVAELLEKRFVDALVEMGDTCTTGHVARLVYVLEGFGVAVKISFREQIIANVSARITAIARDQKDPKVREILDLGVMEDADPAIREAYTTWMRKELTKLEEVLAKEFKSYVKRSYFDEAFAEAAKQLLGTT